MAAVAGRRVVVLDHGSGNLRSVQRALQRIGAAVTVTSDLDLAGRADGLVVPGVGAYAACMEGIERIGARAVIVERVARGAPVLGICVGMQVLFDSGSEHGTVTKGLGLIPGEVSRLPARRVPHMGWNTVAAPDDSILFAAFPPATRFYFVHSYAAAPAAGQGPITTCLYGQTFVAAVERPALAATQFHPEKSGEAGAVLLRNWLETLC